MMAGTHTDIAERKAFELGQREAATVFSSSYEGIMVVGPDRRIIRVNPAFTRITGYSQEEVQGRSPGMLSFSIRSFAAASSIRSIALSGRNLSAM